MAENIEISLKAANVVNYYQCRRGIPPVRRLYIKNTGKSDLENVTVRLRSEPEFLLCHTLTQGLLPRDVVVNFDANVQLSPLFLCSLNDEITGDIIVEVLSGDKLLASETCSVRIMAYNQADYESNHELLAGFVRRSEVCSMLAEKARRQLTAWKKNDELGGYYGKSKNDVRFIAAAIYNALAESHLTLGESESDAKVFIASHQETMETGIVRQAELALLYASVAESAGLNGIVFKSGKDWGAAVWLSEQCASEAVIDEGSYISKRTVGGINELSAISVKDITAKIAYEAAEKRCTSLLKDSFDFAVDIKRARILGVKALPERIMTADGYDLVEEDVYAVEEAPEQIAEFKGDLNISAGMSKQRQWERRLLDLTMRNSLLNFKPNRTAVKLFTGGLNQFLNDLDIDKTYAIMPTVNAQTKLKSFGDVVTLKPITDLIHLEQISGKLHTVYSGEEHDKTMQNIYRKDKTFLEESGTNSLFIAAGFLKWRSNEDNELKYAPLMLYPVALTRLGGATDKYNVTLMQDEVRLNYTLLEYLYQEFGIDLRGINNLKQEFDAQTVQAVLTRIRKEIVDYNGWDLTDDVYLTSLSFSNYLMWKDIRNKLDKFRESKLISALVDGGSPFGNERMNDASSDETYNGEICLPISADSSQYSAIVDSLSKSFVLHGPPGTGKSQTITNIIANNILQGRRVLFVAEKMAALSIVKKRLDDIGIGDFCLELHSNKSNKTEIVRKMLHTLKLPEEEPNEDYGRRAEEIKGMIEQVQDSMDALHKTRFLGVSVYEGIMRYWDNEDAPDCLRIDSMFFEKLTHDTLFEYENLLGELVACSAECGEISRSPFKDIGYFEYTSRWREKAEQSIELMEIEVEHVRKMAGAFMRLLKVRTASLTHVKLKALYAIAKELSTSVWAGRFFSSEKIEEYAGMITAYSADKKKYNSLMQATRKDYYEIPDDLDKDGILDGSERKRRKAGYKLLRRMDKYLINNGRIGKDEENLARFTSLYFAERDYNEKKAALAEVFGVKNAEVDRCMLELKTLYDAAEELYAEYSEATFNQICKEITGTLPNRILLSYVKAYESYQDNLAEYTQTFALSGGKERSEIGETVGYLKRLKDNLDLMPSWCRYNKIINDCKDNGLDFVIEPLRSGQITGTDILRSFRKSVYGYFISQEISLDKRLSEFSGKTLEERMEKLKLLTDTYENLTRNRIYCSLVNMLPRSDEEGAHNLEMVTLVRADKTNMKGNTLRKLFTQIPTLVKAACPCMLMSPVSVTQFLDPDNDKFDLVVFDEASQMPTCEAIGAIARAKEVIVVGDPKQLPPTKFFNADYRDEENPELEDLESILDDCLSLGMPEKHLLWHYRSKDESLIAFSNAMYYENKLMTFPSPGTKSSKVTLKYVDGVYERGGSKRNKKEAETLVNDVVTRLKNGETSIGIITFNTAQQNFIEDLLQDAIRKNRLERAAYESDEPIFVKNLENVQGDEREVILFSVGYGPDITGRLSLNFGPINQAGGYRRLNVAVTRARSEMVVYSSITGNMIDLSKTDSKGVKGLKAFLEYAERGRDMLAVDSKSFGIDKEHGIGYYIAEDLRERGYECVYDVGVSDFKIDVAVVDPKDKDRYILAIICDGKNSNNMRSVRDRMATNTRILKQLGWNVYYMWTLNYLANSKREMAKLKEYIQALTSVKAPSKKSIKESISKYKRAYKPASVRPIAKANPDYVTDEEHTEAILAKINAVIEAEQPIEEELLLSKLSLIFNITKTNKKAYQRLTELTQSLAEYKETCMDKTFYVYKTAMTYDYFRPIDAVKGKRELNQIHPCEIVGACRCVLENMISLDTESLRKEVLTLINYTRKTKLVNIWIDYAQEYGALRGQLILTSEGKVTM